MTHPLELRIIDRRLGTLWPLPTYASDGAAGFDLRACVTEAFTLWPNETRSVSAGFAMHIGDKGLVGLMFPRSGLGRKGIVLANLTGVIDADYQGELSLLLWNRSDTPYHIEPGERVAQMVLTPVVHAQVQVVSEFSAQTTRGSGGFGSTGSG